MGRKAETVKKTRDPQIFSKNVHHFTLHGFFFCWHIPSSSVCTGCLLSFWHEVQGSPNVAAGCCFVAQLLPTTFQREQYIKPREQRIFFHICLVRFPEMSACLENKATTDDCPKYRDSVDIQLNIRNFQLFLPMSWDSPHWATKGNQFVVSTHLKNIRQIGSFP